jgi:hypothetical protein
MREKEPDHPSFEPDDLQGVFEGVIRPLTEKEQAQLLEQKKRWVIEDDYIPF